MVGREPIGFLRLLRHRAGRGFYAGLHAIMGAGARLHPLFACLGLLHSLIYDRRAQRCRRGGERARSSGRFGVIMVWGCRSPR